MIITSAGKRKSKFIYLTTLLFCTFLLRCSNENKKVIEGVQVKITSEIFKKSTFLDEEKNENSTIEQILNSRKNSINTIYVHFWATWCAPCLIELPKLVEYIDKLNLKESNTNLLLLIAVDDSKDKIRDFLKKIKIDKINSVLLLDNAEEAYLKFGVSKVPETFRFNQKGQLIQKFIGPQIW